MPTSLRFKTTNFTVATKTANLWKPPESTRNHLQVPKTIHRHPKPSTDTQNHPHKNICNHPKITITTLNHPHSAEIYLELAVAGMKPSISVWEHPQSFTRYLRPTLVFMWNSTLRQKFNFYPSEAFASIDKGFISRGGLSTGQ